MKKTITALIAAALVAGSAFAQQPVEVSGEFKTGFYTEEMETAGETFSKNRVHNNDGDSGDGEGRIRFNINFGLGDFGLRTQFFQDDFTRGTGPNVRSTPWIKTNFIYAYANMFDEQLKISAGLLGESPWGSGGPELFKELEYNTNGDPITGIRFEWTPNFLHGLNLGFVLNRDDDKPPGDAKEIFGDMLQETVVGVTYEHEYFAFTFAYRFNRDVDSPAADVTGAKLLYRVEERFLRTLLPGMAIWANGYGFGIGAEEGKGSGRSTPGSLQNWLYILYDPDYFSVGVNIGYVKGLLLKDERMEFRPFVFGKFFNNFLNVGVTAGMEIALIDNSRNSKNADDFYNFWFVEPQIKFNLTGNFYAAAVYRYTLDKKGSEEDPNRTTHWFNLRFCYAL
jgi:hypothetical protein